MKKNFTTSPAAAFITKPENHQDQRETVPHNGTAEDQQRGEPVIMFRKPRANRDEEARTRRGQYIIRPSVHNAATDYAQKAHISFNSLIELALLEYIANNAK